MKFILHRKHKSLLEISWLLLFTKLIEVYCENHMKHVNREWALLKRTARVCVTALEGLRTTRKSARNFHKFL
jgi:hypothetical protein